MTSSTIGSRAGSTSASQAVRDYRANIEAKKAAERARIQQRNDAQEAQAALALDMLQKEKKGTSAMTFQTAELFICNFVTAVPKGDLKKMAVTREMTLSQIPVALLAKYSDDQGNLLTDSLFDKGLKKGKFLLNKAFEQLNSPKS